MEKLLMLSFFLISIVVTSYSQISNSDKESIYNIVRDMELGWNTNNGKTFARGFAPSHEYIVWNGIYLSNQSKEGNEMAHQGLFDSVYKTTDIRLVVQKMTSIREDLILLHVLGATFEQNTPVPENPKVIITMLLEKKNNNWSIISFHNSDIEIFEPGAINRSPVPAEAMYGSWYASR